MGEKIMAKRKPAILTRVQAQYLAKHRDAMPLLLRDRFMREVLENLTGPVGDGALMSAIECALVAGYIRGSGSAFANEEDHDHAAIAD
jgi:hypothetical protein